MRRTSSSLSPLDQLSQTKQMPGLVVVTGNETLLVIEAADAVRERARQEGFTDRHSFVMDARGDWQQIFLAASSGSLFGERQLIEITLPSGKPGKLGAPALVKLAEEYSHPIAQDALVLIKLPALDRQSQESAWYKTLSARALVFQCPDVSRRALPDWIQSRLTVQAQTIDADTLDWMANHVEGNLLAAHQEILKLGLLYPAGVLTAEQVQAAVLNVARYDIMALRDAMLDGNPRRTLRILKGLRAEGEALPLVLWAVSEELRVLVRVLQASEQGQSISAAMRSLRIFGTREQKLNNLIQRMSLKQLNSAVDHAHDIDRLIKGISVEKRLDDAWEELARLTMRVAIARTR